MVRIGVLRFNNISKKGVSESQIPLHYTQTPDLGKNGAAPNRCF